MRQFQASEPILLPAIQALRAGLDDALSRVEAQGARTEATLAELAAALVEAATVAEVMAYLRTRITDWDQSPWHADQAPSLLERRLRVRDTGAGPPVTGGEIAAGEALAGQRMLVVLGGPGSGKTWLARRYAREAAQTALEQLDVGAGLDAVEVPLFTTWDRWVNTPGSARESLVDASFAAGLGHRTPDESSVARLRRAFLEPGRRVLMVVDSLDEAADRIHQANRLYELGGLPDWRVVVTSRPVAWQATARGDTRPRVVELEQLAYPDDVDAFIRTWFTRNPARGESLIHQIQARPDLARVAVIPLILTFHCLLAEEDPTNAAEPVPARRRDLYTRLVRRLLLGRWAANAPGADTRPNLDDCEATLRGWAWHAVRDRITPAGLGAWGETFSQPSTPLGSGEARALDHVAPKLAEDDEGRITRQFIHRTILEHLVAEHIGTLKTREATEILLPHLWFDPDWVVAAPAAIVAHNRRKPGRLLQQLIDHGYHPAPDPARQAAVAEFDRILLAVAENSDPNDWTLEHQRLTARLPGTTRDRDPEAIGRTAHWAQSNPRVLAAILAVLPTAAWWAVAWLAGVLPDLDVTEEDRAQARAAVLAALPTADAWAVAELVGVLPDLDASEEDRAQARAAVLAALPTADAWAVAELVGVLPDLDASEEDRAQARAAVLAALPTAGPGAVARLAGALPDLTVTEEDRAQARAAVLAALPTANPGAVTDLVSVLPALDVTEEDRAQEDRAQARAAVLAALPTADAWDVARLAGVLPALDATQASAWVGGSAADTHRRGRRPRHVGANLAGPWRPN